MPYVRVGKVIYKNVDGRLVKKQECDSIEDAKKALNLLRGIEHGWRPTQKK